MRDRLFPVRLAALCLTGASVPAFASDVPLSPIGLPFKPGAPQPLAPDHPLYHHVALDPVEGMPSVVGAGATLGLSGAAKRSSFDKALRDTLAALNMLAPSVADARVTLKPRWVSMEAPFKIGFSSKATARLAWTLTRIDSGKILFQREIATSAESRGGDGTSRANGVGRVALMTNIASVALCLDKAAYGQAPGDCALNPAFTYHAPTYTIMFIPRF